MTSPHPLNRFGLAAAIGLAFTLTMTPAGAAFAEDERSDPGVSFHFGYLGELAFHPGAFAGVEWRALREGPWDLLVTGNVAGYAHLRNHVGLQIYAELGTRLHLDRVVALELLAGLGYLHTFLAGPVYEVDDAGVVDPVGDPGRASVMPTASLGISVACPGVTPFLRIQVFGEYPFNQSMLAHLAVLLGVRL